MRMRMQMFLRDTQRTGAGRVQPFFHQVHFTAEAPGGSCPLLTAFDWLSWLAPLSAEFST
uniref:Uncharacterized protein n=1 Tax=Arundo donax TaxID=35708 RepID=A0A0A9CTK3_ARUDO